MKKLLSLIAMLMLSAAVQAQQPKALLDTRNLSDLANASTARTNMGVAIGTNVQAYDADLTTWAGKTVTASAAELNFSVGVTSAIQTQLDAKQATITFGTGVQTALGVNVGSAGAPVLFNGAGGTPSSITLTNASGTAASLTAGNVTTNANLTGHITSTGNAAVLGSFSFTQLNTALTGDDAAGLATNNALTGQNTTALGFEHAWTSQSTGAQNYAINSRYYISTFTTDSIATFTGTPVNGSTVRVLLENCDGVATFTYPSAIRLPSTTASSVITPPAGDHLLVFEYRNSIWNLTDTIPPVSYASDAGGDDTYAFTVPNYAAYAAGDSFTFTVATANTGAATANINAIGAVTLKKASGGVITTDLETGDLLAGQTFTVTYNGTNFLVTSPIASTITTTAIDTNAELRAITVGLGAVVQANSSTFASPDTTTPRTLTAADCYGFILYYGATGTINLPAGVTGMNGIIYNTGAFTITIDPNGSEVVVRDGTAQTGGVSFTLSSGAGNYVAIHFDGTRWVTLGFKGTLSVGS